MKAIVFRAPNKFDMEEVPKPKCPIDGVLIKVEAVGLCGSDVRTFSFGLPGLTLPQIIGHEIAGEIVELGKNIKNYKEGERVIIDPLIHCGKCYYCKNGLENHCKNIRVVGTHIPGGYAQYVAIPGIVIKNNCIFKLDSRLSYNYAPLAETAASVINAQKNINVKKNDIVLVIGAGPIGCLHCIVAKIRGARKVILSEINENRLEIVKKFENIDMMVNSSKQDLKEVVLKETDNLGVDIVIVACPVGKVQEQALELVKCRGKVLFFGGLPKDNSYICINSNNIHYNEINITGAYAYTPREFKEALEFITENRIPASKFITDVLSLKDIKKGIDIVKNGLGIKVILKPWE
jgi:L-iditol 2-dehydrogenase